jgi:glycosyltransferase involved in cell wall biosynthesis
MKIAQLMAGAAQGGAELFFERMSIALARRGHEVLPVMRDEAARSARLRAAGLDPVALRFGGRLDPFTRPRARRVLEAFGADIAIAWMSRAAFHVPRGRWCLLGRLGGYYDLKYFRRCDHLAGNTRDIVRWIVAEGWPRERVHYLPNFVADFAGTAPAPRAALGVPEGAKLVLALGRLHAVKGFDVLIRAALLMPDVHVAIAGEGPERASLTKLVDVLGLAGRVHFLGWRTDTGGLLRTADVFASSSSHEPLGNMVLEAFSARVPVVATAAEGPREVITNGVDGVLVPIGDAAALASEISRVLSHPDHARSLAAAGRAHYERAFSEAGVVAAWQALLERLRPG